MKANEIKKGMRVIVSHPDSDACRMSGLVGVIETAPDESEGCEAIVSLGDGIRIGFLAHELESLENSNVKPTLREYTVSMRVDGRVNVIVQATSFEEAFEKAQEEEYDPTEVECIEYEPVNATDENGRMEDFA